MTNASRQPAARVVTRAPGFDALIDQVSRLVHGLTGVQLGERQRSMVETRVSRRMLDLNFHSPTEYAHYLETHRAKESEALVALLTTHHTFFFREFEHFEFLRDEGLPKLAQAMKAKGKRHLRVWSMACSRGQEVYSLVMFLLVHWPQLMPGGTFEILGTDVDGESVKLAQNGVYRAEEIKSVPTHYVGQHWARGTGDIAAFVRAKDALRKTTRFAVGNLFKIDPPRAGEAYDLIFCRNVFIYFTPDQIRGVTTAILPHLAPDGYFVIGTTESLNGLNLPINYVGASVYQAPPPAAALTLVPSTAVVAAPVPTVKPQGPIRVFCVDDSPTVHALLKNILGADHGFEIVGTAANGQEALDRAFRVEYDVMTLDIHMPVKTGADYLAERRKDGHPPVVVLSSIAREEATLGIKTLQLGAVDYVEKPSLANLAERGEELRTKLRCAVHAFRAGASTAASGATALALATTLKRTSQVAKPDQALRIIYLGTGDRDKVGQLLSALGRPQPPTLILCEGPQAVVTMLADALTRACILPIKVAGDAWPHDVPAGGADVVWVASAATPPASLVSLHLGKRAVTLVYASVSTATLRNATALGAGPLFLEDALGDVHPDKAERERMATQVLPYTSFLFDSDYVLNREEG